MYPDFIMVRDIEMYRLPFLEIIKTHYWLSKIIMIKYTNTFKTHHFEINEHLLI